MYICICVACVLICQRCVATLHGSWLLPGVQFAPPVGPPVSSSCEASKRHNASTSMTPSAKATLWVALYFLVAVFALKICQNLWAFPSKQADSGGGGDRGEVNAWLDANQLGKYKQLFRDKGNSSNNTDKLISRKK